MTKRLFDILFASIGILLLSPLYFVVSLAVKIDSSGPVFYRGERVGFNGRLFRIFKFRTMVENAEKIGGSSTSDDDPRITGVGRLLRKSKLDELPQLFNVFMGHMSFVGPRPEVKKYTDSYTDNEKIILKARPGITDWASIWNSDEGALLAGAEDPDKAYEELIRPTKLQLQLQYVREISLFTDLQIILLTLIAIINPKNRVLTGIMEKKLVLR